MEDSKKTLKDIIAEEYIKCANDPAHFMRKYCKIQHPTKGKIYFNLYPFQQQCLTDFNENRLVIINKGRQLGISTLVAAYSINRMVFVPDFKVLVIATKQSVAKNLVQKVRIMYDNLPSWMIGKGEYEEHNKLSLSLKNGSSIKAVSATADAGRSEALSLLIIDEAAHIDKIDDIWTAAQSTLSTGGGAILLSSPAGAGNLFHKIWVDANNGGEFFPIRLPWYVHPERDQTWRDHQDSLLGPKMAAQENDCSFVTSGYTVIEGPVLDWYRNTYEQEPIEKRGYDTNYWIWSYPDRTKTYIVAADVSRGDGEDYSTFVIIDAENLEQVGEYKGLIPTKDFGHMLVSVATEWNNALLVIDHAGVGWAVIDEVKDRGYTNLFHHYKNDPYVDPAKHIILGYDLKDETQMTPGVSINTKTRPVMVSKFETYFREKSPICKSRRSLDEFTTFIWKNGKPIAMGGYNDDLVMSWAMAFWVRDTALKLKNIGLEIEKNSLRNIQKQVYSSRDSKKGIPRMKIPGVSDESLEWLL